MATPAPFGYRAGVLGGTGNSVMDEVAYEMLRLNTKLVTKVAAVLGADGYFSRKEMHALRAHVAKAIAKLPLERTGDLYEIDAILEDGLSVMPRDD